MVVNATMSAPNKATISHTHLTEENCDRRCELLNIPEKEEMHELGIGIGLVSAVVMPPAGCKLKLLR